MSSNIILRQTRYCVKPEHLCFIKTALAIDWQLSATSIRCSAATSGVDRPNLSFNNWLSHNDDDCLIKGCGVIAHLIHACLRVKHEKTTNSQALSVTPVACGCLCVAFCRRPHSGACRRMSSLPVTPVNIFIQTVWRAAVLLWCDCDNVTYCKGARPVRFWFFTTYLMFFFKFLTIWRRGGKQYQLPWFLITHCSLQFLSVSDGTTGRPALTVAAGQ